MFDPIPQNVPISPVDQFGGIQSPEQGPAPTQMPPELAHINDVLGQYIQTKQDQNPGGLTQSLLQQRFQPTMGDAATAGLREAQSYASPQGFKPYSPEGVMAERYANEYAPYTSMLEPQAKVAQIGLQGAQANALNQQVPREIAEKQFEYANDPQMQQARIMGQYLQGMGGQANGSATGNPNQTNQPANGQPAFNPMGAMLAKQFGMDNMQIGANGQPQLIPGTVSPGQKEQDTNFAQAYQTYANAGGASRTQNAINVVQQTIDALKQGSLQTGGLGGAFSMEGGEPTGLGKIFNRDVLIARNNISSAILPQAKALFGARVTNFDAQSLINSQGLDPMADTQTNINKLQNLINSLKSGQQDLQTSGQYFQQHGTLSGYQPNANSAQPLQPGQSQNQSGSKTINFSDLPP